MRVGTESCRTRPPASLAGRGRAPEPGRRSTEPSRRPGSHPETVAAAESPPAAERERERGH